MCDIHNETAANASWTLPIASTGRSGLLAEIVSSGPVQILGFGIWVLVYGFMVYAPMRAVGPRAGALPPFWSWGVAIVLPLIAAVLVAQLVVGLRAIVD